MKPPPLLQTSSEVSGFSPLGFVSVLDKIIYSCEFRTRPLTANKYATNISSKACMIENGYNKMQKL